MLHVRVGHNHKQTPRIQAIVDSGSPYCLFKSDVGQYLGIDIEKGIEAPISGISQGMQEPAFFHRVKIYVEADWVITVTAGFCKKLSVPALLGRNGFFDSFYIRFDHSANPPIFELSKIEKVQ
jgi:hypothetical protein